MSAPEPNESRALAALTELLRDAVKRPTASEVERGFQTFRSRASARTLRSRMSRKVLAIAAVACVVVLGSVTFWVSRERPGVSMKALPLKAPALARIEGGEVLTGGYLSELEGTGIRLFFDEGSEFVLSPGARGRLRLATSDGTRLALEHGAASLSVAHHAGHRWSVEAGPFLVTVEGTEFAVAWDPASERFEVTLRRGRVTVSGPIVGERLVLKAGQKLSVSLPKAETVITEDRLEKAPALPAPSGSSVDVSASQPPSGDGAQGRAQDTGRPAASASRGTTERRWHEALANGGWDEILADAERAGIDATLETAASEDLFALSDAARYRRRLDLARAALLAQRRRFPSAPRSTDALFLLGRVEELRSSAKSPAIAYYDEYLSRAPSGTYAAEALGRKMVLTKEASGAASARALADEYLRRFPGGSYAGAARALQRTPQAPR